MTGALAQQALAERVQAFLPVLIGAIALLAALCVATNASAEQPTELLELRSMDRGVPNILQFEAAEGHRSAHGSELRSAPPHLSLTEEVLNRPAPRWPSAADTDQNVAPPVIVMRDYRSDDPRDQLAWGLAGTGASIFTGAVLYHIETMALQDEYEQLSSGAHNARYREIRNQIDQTRKFVLALYAVGGSMVTSGVVLMANDERGGPTAKIAPAWMNGGPAARLKIKF